ncbi:MAG: IclR family transcriptional regulator [Opitutaceae bacterium]|nr:IclR family transcriptional regulator [Opitutaceae bacterium]
MGIAVIDKTFSALEVLARADGPRSLAELAAECRLPRPTAFRILKSLRDLGYVVQAARGAAYALSPRLASLQVSGRDEAVRRRVLPLMTQLHAAFDETVNLGFLEGCYIRYAHLIETTQPLRWIVRPGARDGFHTTALGRAVVAELPEEQQARLVARACASRPARQRASARAALARELAATRARGYALEEEETAVGVACVAVSLAASGEPLAAVSVSVPVHRFPASRRAELVAALLDGRSRAAASA